MEQSNNLPAHLRSVPPEKITKQNIIALFNTETIRWNYNKMLQGLKGMRITKDNLQSEYPEFKEADKFVKTITEWRKQQAKPFNDVDALFLEVSKEIIEPISEVLTTLKAQVKSASEANAAEIAQAKREQAKKDLIAVTMGQFINKITADITLATTDEEIASIQMLMGTEKSKKTFYADYYQELVDKCEALNPTINEQKQKIRDLKKFNAQFEQAVSNNDDKKASEIKEQIELTTHGLVENSIRLQERAFEQSLTISQVQVGQPEVNIAKGKTTRWKWKVENIDMLHKRYPQYTRIIPNNETIDELMKEQRILGSFNTDHDEILVSGITFYKEKYF